MSKVPDRKRLRREYVRKKGGGLLCAIFLFAVGLVGAVYFLFGMNTSGIIKAGLGGLFFVVCLTSIEYGIKRAKRATAIPYVPPVIPNLLPADEILVRGSEEPSVEQSGVLLRAVQAGQETPEEELLRVRLETDEAHAATWLPLS